MPLRRPILTFLSLVAVAEVLLTIASRRVDPQGRAGAAVMIGVMWAPGLAGMLVQLLSAGTLRGLGWKPGKAGCLAIGYLAPLVYAAVPCLIASAIGAGHLNPGRWADGAAHWGYRPHIATGLLLLTTLLVLPGLVMGLGEEIGWRGFLVPRLAERFGFWGTVNVSAAIWLVFHLPGMLMGDYGAHGTPLVYQLVCFSALIYAGTVLFTWLRLKSGSVWPSAIAHATHNTFIQIMFGLAMVYDGRTAWLVGEFGCLTPCVVGLIAFTVLEWGGVPETKGSRRAARASSAVEVAAA